MILKASQRGGAGKLATHLLKTEENEHVEVHEIRGFLSEDLKGALKEVEAQSQGTRCKQPLFSLSLSPPEHESVSIDVFEQALAAIEQKLRLENQPRVVVFHEKNGRRHCHAVWSRIDAEQMKAINLPHFKMKLQDVSKQLYLEHGWNMPRGFEKKEERDPLNYTRAEFHQAQRVQEDPKAVKAFFQKCWQMSDSQKTLTQSLKARGYILAAGDRRAFVAVDHKGEVYPLSRWAGAKAKDLQSRITDQTVLPSVTQAKEEFAKVMTDKLKGYAHDVMAQSRQKIAEMKTEKQSITLKHQEERQKLTILQQQRFQKESQERNARHSRSWRAAWDYVTGKYQRVKEQNASEALQGQIRDKEQRQALIDRQREERQGLQAKVLDIKAKHQEEMNKLREYLAHYTALQNQEPASLKQEFARVTQPKEVSTSYAAGRNLDTKFNNF